MAVDYSAVLADLKERRDKLNVTIAAIEEIAKTIPASAASRSGPTELRPDSFFQMPVLDAAVAYLRMMKRPKGASEIADALEAGGLTHSSKSFPSTVYTTLKRDADKEGEIIKVGQNWGLAEWYPGRARKTPRARSVSNGIGAASAAEAWDGAPADEDSQETPENAIPKAGGSDSDVDDLPFE